jgi:hypothetical protein
MLHIFITIQALYTVSVVIFTWGEERTWPLCKGPLNLTVLTKYGQCVHSTCGNIYADQCEAYFNGRHDTGE